MRILVVIPHFCGVSQPDNPSLTIASYLEPLGRIAALSETIIGLHRHFGPHRLGPPEFNATIHDANRASLLDIVVVGSKDYSLLDHLNLAPGTVSAEYVSCRPTEIPLQVPRILGDRFGSYDFYCYLEDDLVIHDPLFFAKIQWFQQAFGPKTLLAPVRFEMGSTGTPAKVIIDPILPESFLAPFRRPGQQEEITALWQGKPQSFHLPSNPHAAAYFLTSDQMNLWMDHPSFDDRDITWVGPIESAATLSVGKVFDIYKPGPPDSFFLELHHQSTGYVASFHAPQMRIGEPPLLAIAQGALRALHDQERAGVAPLPPGSELLRQWTTQGTVVEAVNRLPVLERTVQDQASQLESLSTTLGELHSTIKALEAELRERQAAYDQLANMGLKMRLRFFLTALRARAAATLRRWAPSRQAR